MSDTQYDVVVIGAGPGGYVAAIRSAQLGLKTAIVEREYWGGVCLNIGCIPTKALLHSADLLEEARDSKQFGIVIPQVDVDWGGVMKYKEKVVKQMTGGVNFLMKKNKIDTYNGSAKFVDRTTISVTSSDGKESRVTAKNIIIATGSQPRALPPIGGVFDEDRIISSTGALALSAVPKSIIIVGAGAIGVEFASAFRAFGAQVTIIEALPRLVPVEDEEISAELARAFNKRGIKVFTGAKLTKIDKGDGQVTATFTDADGKEQQLTAERLLLGIGRAPNTKDLGLEAAGVELDQRGFVKVDDFLKTNVPGIYAIGDVAVTTPWLAHKASAEGIMVAEEIAGHTVQPINYRKVPGCTYSNPEIASVGLTEAQAHEQGYDVKIGKFPFSANGKATILGQRNGFIKIVAEKKYDEVLGVHIIGPHATELIAEGGVALSHEATAESLMRTIHAHPTLYEALGEAEHATAEGAAIHI
ncbi:MAG: dihydrolipoyl dehydrogenase [Chloroflexi bacterium SZAS-1]|nr:dihydrolipoyl dehydrogenase [Chloroflexi bacterium SZAS-1]